MKFTILQQDFLPALSAVARSCGVRSQLPVLGNILLQTNSGKIKLSATNLEIGVVKSINAEIIEEGEITVPSRTLVEVVANLAGEKIEVSASADQLQITTSTFSSQINGISATEFPHIPLAGSKAAIITPDILVKALPQVSFATAVDDGRPQITGILIEIKDNKLQLVATDGFRLAHKVVGIPKSSNFKALVPRKTLEEVVRLIGEDVVDEIIISTSDDQNQIIFQFAGTQLSSRLIEGQFPAWEKIIPGSAKARVILEKGEFVKAVKLASVFTRNEANIVKLQNLPEKMILTSEAKEVGSQKKEIIARSEGEQVQITFNTRYLIEALSAMNSSQVIVELSGSLSAAVLKPVGEEGLQYIIMPVNLS